MKRVLLLMTLVLTSIGQTFAGGTGCLPNEVPVYFEINVTNWAYEVSYDLVNGNGTILFSGQLANTVDADTQSICVPDDECMLLTVYDTYGDGINQTNDYFMLVLDGDTIVYEQDYNFGNETAYEFNCPQGATCYDPFDAQLDVWTAANFDNTWYEFTPDTTGLYQITTCDSNTCNTQIWIFEDCSGNIYTENEEGALSYSDDAVGCSPQSQLQSALEAGVTYYIRIGDYDDDCPGVINWLLTFEGPVVGCMDPTMCNYEPLATVAGPCYTWGSPECPDGPDLIMDQQYAINTISLDNIYMDPNSNYDNCQVQEGCVRGMGDRTIIRFATRIANIGTTDYYIGTPGANPSQFDFTNCHGHTHYKGYAEYLLYDMQGNEIPVGFKAGFCVMDIDCNGGGTGGYNCGNMGISAGCADIYGSGTTCNWIDITDVDTGDYTFVLRTNWDFDPDALGRYETNHLNNWAQICINIGMDNMGNKTFALNQNCPTFTDCNGVAYGDAQVDCNGVCEGDAIPGDINQDDYQNLADAQEYVSEILSNGSAVNNCNDLNGDGEITVFDAALVQDCYYGEFDTTHAHGAQDLLNHCQFPYGYTNIGDTVFLTIMDYNLQDQYFDIGVKNPYNTILAYEFEMSGLEITTAENLIPNSYYPISPETALGDDKVIGMSYQDSVVPKSFVYVPLVRVNYFQLTDSTICISDIIEVVSGLYESTVVVIEDGCVQLSSNNMVSIASLDTICGNEDGVALNASPNGGYFFGDGVIQEVFYPEIAGPGTHEIFYYYPNVLPVSTFVTVLDADIIVMDDMASMMDTDPMFDLLAMPAGGTFSGVGVENGNQFNPATAGAGEHIVTYTYPMNNGCMASKEMIITVNSAVGIIDVDNTLNVSIEPNPFNQSTMLRFDNPKRVPYTLEIVNSVGQLVRTYTDIKDEAILIEKGELAEGVYIYRLNGAYKNTGRFVIY